MTRCNFIEIPGFYWQMFWFGRSGVKYINIFFLNYFIKVPQVIMVSTNLWSIEKHYSSCTESGWTSMVWNISDLFSNLKDQGIILLGAKWSGPKRLAFVLLKKYQDVDVLIVSEQYKYHCMLILAIAIYTGSQ